MSLTRSMRRTLALGVLALAPASSQAQQNIQITVMTALAPNLFGSPSWSAWQNNAARALAAGTTVMGPANSPTQFEAVTQVTPNQLVVSGFPSWNGQASPAAPYQNELGRRLHWVYMIRDLNGGKVDIANGVTITRPVSPWRTAQGPGVASTYNPLRWGVNLSGDPLNPFSSIVQSSSGQFDAILGFAPGLADEPPAGVIGTEQERLDAATNAIAALGPFTQTHIIEYGGVAVSASVAVVPEPSTYALLATGLAGVGLTLRRRRR